MSRILIIIPARLASTRFPAKPLALLTGADGVPRPALHYTWQAGLAAARALGPQARCTIATDDQSIADLAAAEGMAVVMTPTSCANGTERCAAALA
jgi:3-deoxy-manno-octulosonate cytidylyltransferase (CMP-KDO synthetase)